MLNILISIEAEPIISLGSVLGYELYKRGVPILTITKEEYESIPDGALITVKEDGRITVE